MLFASGMAEPCENDSKHKFTTASAVTDVSQAADKNSGLALLRVEGVKRLPVLAPGTGDEQFDAAVNPGNVGSPVLYGDAPPRRPRAAPGRCRQRGQSCVGRRRQDGDCPGMRLSFFFHIFPLESLTLVGQHATMTSSITEPWLWRFSGIRKCSI